MADYCISVNVINEDWDEPRQTVGTPDEIVAIAWQYAGDARSGRQMSVNIFHLVPNPPKSCGLRGVTFDWKQIRHYEDIGRLFTEGFEALREAELPF